MLVWPALLNMNVINYTHFWYAESFFHINPGASVVKTVNCI
jgi:hypothetical protein